MKDLITPIELANPEGKMTEEAQAVETQELDYKVMYEETKQQLDVLAAHQSKLYQETKQAKAEREAVKQQAMQLQAEDLKKAEKAGEFEKLWKTEAEQRKAIEEQLNSFKTNIRQEKINNQAMKLAVELAKGDADRAELLTAFVSQSLANVADEFGTIDMEVLKGVQKEFEANKKFAPLLGGTLATGGGAPGSTARQTQTKEISRAEFEKLDHTARGKFFQTGGKLVDM
jgi:chromosome segregation ATPase